MIGPPHYVAPAPTACSTWLSRATLALVFGATFFYPLILLLLLLGLWYCPWLSVGIVCISCWSLRWSNGSVWRAVGQSRVFEAWRAHFGLRVWRETPPLTGPVLFVMVPHGVFPLGLPLFAGIYESVFPELARAQEPRAAVASIFFWLPFLAPLVSWLGGIPAHRHVIEWVLRDGASCFLFPDGIGGAFPSPHAGAGKQEICRIKDRNQCTQIALDRRVPIVPVYCFGHNQLFAQSWPAADSWLARASRTMRVAFIWYWPLIPRGRISLVFGQPIGAGQCYQDEVRALYARYASNMVGYAGRELVIE